MRLLLKILALKRDQNVLFSTSQPKEHMDFEDLVYQIDDILVLAGDVKDIRRFLN